MTESEWSRWATVYLRSSVWFPVLGMPVFGPVLQRWLAWRILRRIERWEART